MAKDSSYFTGDRDFWDDGDFETMEEQCVYAMLWQAHGTDIAGIRQRNDRLDSVRVHLTFSQFQDTLSILYTKGKITLYPNKIWIKPGIWRNLGKGNYSEKQMTAVVTRLQHCNTGGLARDVVEYYKEKYGMEIPYTYPTDTLSLCTVPVSVSETVSVPVPETGIIKEVPPPENGGALEKLLPGETRIGGRNVLQDELQTLAERLQVLPYVTEAQVYPTAGWIVKGCRGDIPVALELFHQKANYLVQQKDLNALHAVLTKVFQDPDQMGRIESEAHRKL